MSNLDREEIAQFEITDSTRTFPIMERTAGQFERGPDGKVTTECREAIVKNLYPDATLIKDEDAGSSDSTTVSTSETDEKPASGNHTFPANLRLIEIP